MWVTHLILVGPTLTTDRNTLAHDNLKNPLQQRRVLRVVKDPLDDIETVRRKGNTDGLRSASAKISCEKRTGEMNGKRDAPA